MIGDSAVGLMFRIKSDSSQARTDLKNLKEAVDTETRAAARAGENALTGLSSSINSIGSAVSNIGSKLSASLTLPLTAIGALGVKAALELDAVRTKITALVGDSEKANKKIAELRDLANKSVGVTQSAALESYAQLRGIGGISEETINKVIASLGKLNAAFKIEDMAGFNQNLNQIFTQGFERADIKEAIGRVPFFEQLLEQAFGTSDGEKLKKLKDSGKLTLDSFLSGLSGAIENDSRISNISENLSTKLTKGFERINVALAPLGEIILNAVVPALESLAPYLESASKWFSSLSPAIQTAIVAAGAVAAALGPVLIALGSVAAAIGSLVASAGTIGIVAAAIAGLGVQFATIGAFAVALYKIWTTNFGGIRDYTLEVWEKIKSVTTRALGEIYSFVQAIGGQIVGWWRENYPLIRQTVETVSNAVKDTIGAFLASLQSLWETHGGRITDFVNTYWTTLKNIYSQVINQIGTILKIGMQVINGDWQGAWNSFLQYVQNHARLITGIVSGFLSTLGKYLAAWVPIAVEYGMKFAAALSEWTTKAVVGAAYIIATLPAQIIKLVPILVRAGMSVGAAIWEGIKQGLSGSNLQAPISPTAPQPGGGENIVDAAAGASLPAASSNPKIDEKSAEKARQEQARARAALNQATIAATEAAFKELQEITEKAYRDRLITGEKYYSEVQENERQFRVRLIGLTDNQYDLSKAEEKNATARQAIEIQRRTALEQIVSESNKRIEAAEKLVTDTQKKENEKRVKDSLDTIEKRLEIADGEYKKRIALTETEAAREQWSDEKLRISKQALENEFLEFRRKNLDEQLAAVKGNAEEEARIRDRIREHGVEADVAAARNSTEAIKRHLAALKELDDLISGLNVKIGGSGTLSPLEQFNKRISDPDITRAIRERAKAIGYSAEEMESLLRLVFEARTAAEGATRDRYVKGTGERQRVVPGQPINAGEPIPESGLEQLGNVASKSIGKMFGDEYKENMRLYAELGQSITNTFYQMADAVGSAVEAFVLFGGAGTSFRKFAAELIASIAKMAAVQAVWNVAEGFAKLALAYFGHPTAGPSATAHFIAAGVYAGIAGVAAVAGRAVAGDSFRKESSGQAVSGRVSNYRNSTGNSDNSPRQIIEGRIIAQEYEMQRIKEMLSKPQKIEVLVKSEVKSNDSHIIKTVVENIKRMGDIRDSMGEVANTFV